MPQFPPAEGERRAISGYYPQYRASASLILQSLGKGDLEWIRIADPEAGQLDDFQLGSPSRIDAYQVKWSKYGGLFTFNDLVSGPGRDSTLIGQLAKGWVQFKETYPTHRIVVHLLTNKTPSNSTRASLPVEENCMPTPAHFAAFLEQVWKLAQLTPIDECISIPREWLSVWSALRDYSGLAPDDFEAFARDCSLDFGFQIPSPPTSQSIPDEQFIQEDIDDIAKVLMQSVAGTERIIRLSYDELLKRLGWSGRFKFRHSHYFPVDDRLYQPISSTVEKLTDAVSELSGGYIAVLGSPGSGKSTLLARTLIHQDESSARLIRYYAYVPESLYPANLRGESVNFLHDVGIQIDRAGFRTSRYPVRDDRFQLIERFYRQIELLGRDWTENGRKTIILVDGLDHIDREQHPSNSLLEDLPPPEQVPEGVYFILGTQTDAPLPARVQLAVRNPARKIEMQPLDRRQVFDIIDASELGGKLSDEDREAVFRLSNGHPLYLTYLVNRLTLAEDSQQLRHHLQSFAFFEGDIEATYHSYWTQFNDDEELRQLLGLLARVRGAIDLDWVRKFQDQKVVDRLGAGFAHYFRIDNSTHWYFFHNSFRLFLVEKTSEIPAGTYNDSRNCEFHIWLADVYSKEPEGSRRAWEELHHRALGGDTQRVLELATQSYFRSQFIALRPIYAINADILTGLRAAAKLSEPVAIARLCLAGSEISQRDYYLNIRSLMSILLSLGDLQTLIEHLRNGNQLLIEPDVALEAATLLISHGHEKEAHMICDLSEPLDLLSGTVEVRSRHSESLLQHWARAAASLKPVDELVSAIRRVQVATDTSDRDFGIDAESSTRSLQSRLLLCAGLQLLKYEQWAALGELMDAFISTSRSDTIVRFRLLFNACKKQGNQGKGNSSLVQKYLDEMLDMDRQHLSEEEFTALGELVFWLLGDACLTKDLIQGINQPPLQTGLIPSEGSLAPFVQRFRLNRLLYALGDRRSPELIIPSADSAGGVGVTLFERAVCKVSHIWARAWTGNTMDASMTKLEVLPLLRTFNKTFSDTVEWISWRAIENSKGEFYSLLVSAVDQHGDDALDGLREAFENEWNDSRSRRHWGRGVRRRIVLALLRKGIRKDWGIERLSEIEELVTHEGDVSELVEEHLEQAQAWIDVDQSERAKISLCKAIEAAFGVGYRKDFQLNLWIKWLGRVCEVEVERAPERITNFTLALEGLKKSTEGPAVDSAAELLLCVTSRWSPVRAVQLFLWLTDKGIVRYTNGLRILLSEALQKPDPPLNICIGVIEELLLPTDTTGESDLMASLVKRLSESCETATVINEIRSIASKIQLKAIPSARVAWDRGLLMGLEDAGLPSFDFGLGEVAPELDERESSIWTNLELSGGCGTLTLREVDEKVQSLADLRELREMEDAGSLFDWIPIARRIIENADDVASLQALSSLFEDWSRVSHILVLVSSRLNALGLSKEAWDTGVQALSASNSYGWNRIYDGGTRIQAFKTLASIDQDKVIPLIYDTLVNDLESNFTLVTDAASALSEIFELASPSLPAAHLWSEIEEHTANLISTISAPKTQEIFEPPISDTWNRALIELVAKHIIHPCLPVAQKALRLLGKRLLSQDSETADVLCHLLNESEEYQEHLLILIDAVSYIDGDSVKCFKERVEGFRQSPNWSFRLMFGSISRNSGWVQVQEEGNSRPLPIIYNLTLPPHGLEVPEGSSPTWHGMPVPDSEDPRRIVEPFDVQIESISRLANVESANTFTRVVELMHELSPFERHWSAQAEEQLQASLRSSGLEMPFVRPRARVARIAMFHAVAELEDAGRFSNSDVERLETLLRTYDPQMVLEDPSVRPAQILGMTSRGSDSVEGDWVGRVREALALTHWFLDDQTCVLAEKTTLMRYGVRSVHTEKRFSSLESRVLSEGFSVTGSGDFFPSTLNGSISEYTTLAHPSGIPWMTVCNEPYLYDSPGSDWLAMSPAVAENMGWRLASDGLFRWIDHSGRTMVESVWWTDGPIGFSAYRESTDEVGEGWVILIAKGALDELRHKMGPLSRISLVIRQADNDGNLSENSAISQRPMREDTNEVSVDATME